MLGHGISVSLFPHSQRLLLYDRVPLPILFLSIIYLFCLFCLVLLCLVCRSCLQDAPVGCCPPFVLVLLSAARGLVVCDRPLGEGRSSSRGLSLRRCRSVLIRSFARPFALLRLSPPSRRVAMSTPSPILPFPSLRSVPVTVCCSHVSLCHLATLY